MAVSVKKMKELWAKCKAQKDKNHDFNQSDVYEFLGECIKQFEEVPTSSGGGGGSYSETAITITNHSSGNITIPSGAFLLIVKLKHNSHDGEFALLVPISIIKSQTTGDSGKKTYWVDTFNPSASPVNDIKSVGIVATKVSDTRISFTRPSSRNTILSAAWGKFS